MSIEDAAKAGPTGAEEQAGAPPASDETPGAKPSTRRDAANRSVAYRFFHHPVALTAFIVVAVILAVTYAAPLWQLLGLPDPYWKFSRLNQAPGTWSTTTAVGAPTQEQFHLLGTDSDGYDLLARLVWGGIPAANGALIVLAISIGLGVPLGLIAGYFGKAVDHVLSWISDLLMSIPGIIILLIIAGITHQNLYLVMVAMGVFMIPGYYRLTRSATIAIRNEPYVDAARVSGLTDGRIIFSHIWRVIAAPIVIQTALTAGLALGMQAGLQVLGIGSASEPSWGSMIQPSLLNNPATVWLLIPPSILLGLLIASFAVMGQILGDITGNRVEKSKNLSGRQKAELAHTAAERAANASRPEDDFVVTVTGLRVTYALAKRRVEVVHGVDFAVKRGEVLGIVGESGSGKSQSVFSLLDLLPGNGYAEADEIWIGDTNVLTAPKGARHALLGTTIGYIPQEPISNLDSTFTIGHQLTEPMRKVLGMSRAQARDHAIGLLARVGIQDPQRVMKLYPHEISGGMAQRVLIAGAVSGRPKLLVADEPTTALDVTVQAEVLELLRELQQEYGMSLIIVTHNFGVIADIADYVTVMRDGRVVEHGDVRTIFRRPAQPYTAELIEASTEPETRIRLDREFAAAATTRGTGASG
ncbi:MAG: dipeptide/oligopeptide/nickel ABC transporter permease/ATP-binding protein [Microbacteriaceae bacterium]